MAQSNGAKNTLLRNAASAKYETCSVKLTLWLGSQLNIFFSWVLVAQEHRIFPFAQLHDLDTSSENSDEGTVLADVSYITHSLVVPPHHLSHLLYLHVILFKGLKLLL